MAIRQIHQLKQTQRLSAVQLQAIRLMSLNSLEMEERVNQELLENPALEETSEKEAESESLDRGEESSESEEDITLGDYKNEEEIPDSYVSNRDNNKSDFRIETIYSEDDSLGESLRSQIAYGNLTDQEQLVADYIIGNVDENGYLQRPLKAIADDIFFATGEQISEQELEDILSEIQLCDPAGVGARDLKECLLLQVKRILSSKDDLSFEDLEDWEMAQRILSEQFDAFTKKHFDKIKSSFRLTEKDLKRILEKIVSLNPKPGNALSNARDSFMNQIIPDFVVETTKNGLILHLNDQHIPELAISPSYAELLKGYADKKSTLSAENKKVSQYIKEKVDSAKSFIDAVKQRNETLKKTMEAIIAFQYDFFMTGDESRLHPMILKDIANITGFDISTISRVSNRKYVQTDSGTYPLKYFFSEGMQNDEGEEVSTRKIKSLLKEKIESEDSKHPFTDEVLMRILSEKGYPIARRTVAKYREQLGIPVARLRKRLD